MESRTQGDDVVWLLGAGASKDAGLPLASQMTKQLVENLSRRPGGADVARAMNYVVSSIVAQRGRQGLSPAVLPDVETVASTAELLATRDNVELTPFVQAWDPTVEALDRGVARRGAFADRDLISAMKQLIDAEPRRRHPDLQRRFLSLLREFVADETHSGASKKLFEELLRVLRAELVNLLMIDHPRRVEYLRPLASLGRQPGGVTIATLNYDLTIELAAASVGVLLDRGVDRWLLSSDQRMAFEKEGVRLLKLHGSVDWQRRDPPTVRFDYTKLPQVSLEVKEDYAGDPFLIFGRREKLRPQGPFLELLEEWRNRLRSARALIVVGYSFADEHINETIARWANQRPDRLIAVVDPFFPGPTERTPDSNAFRMALRSGLKTPLDRPVHFGSGYLEHGAGRVLVKQASTREALLDVDQFSYEALRGEWKAANDALIEGKTPVTDEEIVRLRRLRGLGPI